MPGIFIPLVNCPIVASDFSSICFITSFTAVSTRSCSISTSSGSTTSSLICTSVIFLLPSAFTVTIPPPADASNSISINSSCAFTIFFLHFLHLFHHVIHIALHVKFLLNILVKLFRFHYFNKTLYVVDAFTFLKALYIIHALPHHLHQTVFSPHQQLGHYLISPLAPTHFFPVHIHSVKSANQLLVSG